MRCLAISLSARIAGPLFLAAATTSLASACGNDRDAVPMERSRNPDVVAVLSGAYVHHSAAWHEWRVRDGLRKLADPEAGAADRARLPLLDDLGVAYDKLGRFDDAIATGRKALALDPRRYESLANLGTALAHSGRVQEGVALLRQAMEVNPAAHFGRERYEIAYFEYVETRRHDGRVSLPLFNPDPRGDRAAGFPAFLAQRRTPAGETVVPLSSDELAAAATGIAGLIFSTRNDDPALLEVLGHVLVDPNQPWRATKIARPLAARAYLGAALHAGSAPVEAAYRRTAADVLRFETPTGSEESVLPLADLEDVYVQERESGDAFYARLRADEAKWLAAAPDPEAAFAAKYLSARTVQLPTNGWPRRRSDSTRPGANSVGVGVAGIAPPARLDPSRSVPLFLLYAVLGLLGGAMAVGLLTSRTHARRSSQRIRRRFHRSHVVSQSSPRRPAGAAGHAVLRGA